MKVCIVGYRPWAAALKQEVEHAFIVQNLASSAEKVEILWKSEQPSSIYTKQYALTIFVGWSEMVPLSWYTNNLSLVLHPSPLPMYRGGSPIQHQIMAGEDVSAVTLFKLDADYPGIDAGPIAWQKSFSLEGSLKDILGRISSVGAEGCISVIKSLLRNDLRFILQYLDTEPLKRRKPADSEITPGEIQFRTAHFLHDKIRALQAPYPLPFITGADGRRLYILETTVETIEAFEVRKRTMPAPEPFPESPYFVNGGRTERTQPVLASLWNDPVPAAPLSGEPGEIPKGGGLWDSAYVDEEQFDKDVNDGG